MARAAARAANLTVIELIRVPESDTLHLGKPAGAAGLYGRLCPGLASVGDAARVSETMHGYLHE